LPANVRRVLTEFVASAREVFGDDLRAAVLYGSAAEGKLRATSDVNLLLVLSRFDRAKADQLREPLRVAHAAIQLTAMFLLEAEVPAAMQAFAVKFADIARRRIILYGTDPFVGVSASRSASIIRLKQTLLNLTLRWREAYVSRSLREEQLMATIADAAGPLRSCAVALLELEGKSAESPREALERVAASLATTSSAEWMDALSSLSQARQEGALPPGASGAVLFRLIELAEAMRARAEALA
jgi:hypothetical protein